MRATSSARCRAQSAISARSSRRTSPPSSGSIAASGIASSSWWNPISREADRWRRGRRTARAFEEALGKLVDLIEPFAKPKRKDDPLAEPWNELTSAQATMTADIEDFGTEAAAQAKRWPDAARDNAGLNTARAALHPLADRCRDLTKQIDLAAKLAGRVIDIAVKELAARDSEVWDNADISRARKALDEARAEAVEALGRRAISSGRPTGFRSDFRKRTARRGRTGEAGRSRHIEAHDWSLTPGRYVGVAPEEQDEDFDFEETLRAIHIDLKGLNEEAAGLAARIARNFEGLGE